MLADLPRRLTMSLVLVAGSCAALFPVLNTHKAWADDDDDDEGGDDDEASDDDSGDDEGGDEDADEGDEEEGQPPITAGGLYVKATYPLSEIERPLTITKGLIELRPGIGFDVSNKQAFKSFGASLDARYGLQDNVELQAGLKGIYNFKGLNVYGALEAGIVYDLVDFRVAAVVNRPGFLDANGDPASADTGFSIDVGFPFRYAPKPQVAIVALESLFSFDIVADDYNSDGEKDARPDVKPSIGIIIQPVPVFAAKITAEVQIPNFDFSGDNLTVPATLDLQYTASHTLDVGLDFTFANLKAKDPVKFYDTRFLLLFAQFRLGDYKP